MRETCPKTAEWSAPESHAALLATLDDPNEMVAAGAAHALAQLGATNAAPALFTKLTTRLQSTNTSAETLKQQVTAVLGEISLDLRRGPAGQLLDPDRLAMRFRLSAPGLAKPMASRRFPPQLAVLPSHNYCLVDVLIEALGSLCNLRATNCVMELVPLLEDVTPIIYSRPLPGPEWKICDRAALTLAILMGWESPMMISHFPSSQREALLARARQWAKEAR